MTYIQTNNLDTSKPYSSITIGLASPEAILARSYVEILKPETINYRTLKPEMDGLFCEKIFGPSKDWECHCGKYKRVRHRGIVCERCGVEVTESRVRRHMMGFIKLAAPVSHVWYLKGIPSYVAILLDMPLRDVEQIVYFNCYVVLDIGDSNDLKYKQILTEDEWLEIEDEIYAEDSTYQAILNKLNMSGWLRQVPGDYLMVADWSAYSKVNDHITRTLLYDVDMSDVGSTAHLRVRYQNAIESDTLCAQIFDTTRVCYWNYARVYTPLGINLLAVSYNHLTLPTKA